MTFFLFLGNSRKYDNLQFPTYMREATEPKDANIKQYNLRFPAHMRETTVK